MTQITDLAGNYWLAANMFETAVTVMVFTMLYSAILVLVNLFREKAVNID
jgi:putative membrane protein